MKYRPRLTYLLSVLLLGLAISNCSAEKSPSQKDVEVVVINRHNGFYLTSKNIEMVVIRITSETSKTVLADLQEQKHFTLPTNTPLTFEIFAYLSQAKKDPHATVYRFSQVHTILDSEEVVEFSLTPENANPLEVKKVFYETKVVKKDGAPIRQALFTYLEPFTGIEVQRLAGEEIRSDDKGMIQHFFYYLPQQPYLFMVKDPEQPAAYQFGYTLDAYESCQLRLPNVELTQPGTATLSYKKSTDFDLDGVPNAIESENKSSALCPDTDGDGVRDLDQYFPSPIIKSIVGDIGKEGVFQNTLRVIGEHFSASTQGFLVQEDQPATTDYIELETTYQADLNQLFLTLPEDLTGGKYQLRLVNFINESSTHLSILRGNNALINIIDDQEDQDCAGNDAKIIQSGIDYNDDKTLTADEVVQSSTLCISYPTASDTTSNTNANTAASTSSLNEDNVGHHVKYKDTAVLLKDSADTEVGFLIDRNNLFDPSQTGYFTLWNEAQNLLFSIDESTGDVVEQNLYYTDAACSSTTYYAKANLTPFANPLVFKNGTSLFQPAGASTSVLSNSYKSAGGTCEQDFADAVILTESPVGSNDLLNGSPALVKDANGGTHVLVSYADAGLYKKSNNRASTLDDSHLQYGYCAGQCDSASSWTFLKFPQSGTQKTGWIADMVFSGSTLYVLYPFEEANSADYRLASCDTGGDYSKCSVAADFSTNWQTINITTESMYWENLSFAKIFVHQTGKLGIIYRGYASSTWFVNTRFCSTGCATLSNWSTPNSILSTNNALMDAQQDTNGLVHFVYPSGSAVAHKTIDLTSQTTTAQANLFTPNTTYDVNISFSAADTNGQQKLYITYVGDITVKSNERTGWALFMVECEATGSNCQSPVKIDDSMNSSSYLPGAVIHAGSNGLTALYYKFDGTSFELLEKVCPANCQTAGNWGSASSQGTFNPGNSTNFTNSWKRKPAFLANSSKKIFIALLGQQLLHSSEVQEQLMGQPASPITTLPISYTAPFTLQLQ